MLNFVKTRKYSGLHRLNWPYLCVIDAENAEYLYLLF